MGLYWRFFNFAARRVVAPALILGGCVIGFSNMGALFPGGTVLVDGSPSSDLVFRLAVVFLPLLVAVLGVAIYRAKPFVPPGSHDAQLRQYAQPFAAPDWLQGASPPGASR